jgi:hypothetical protein
MNQEYWSASCADVAGMVDVNMEMHKRLADWEAVSGAGCGDVNKPVAVTASWALLDMECKALRARLKSEREDSEKLRSLLRRLRANHPNGGSPQYGVYQMMPGYETQRLWSEVDAVLMTDTDRFQADMEAMGV